MIVDLPFQTILDQDYQDIEPLEMPLRDSWDLMGQFEWCYG